MRVDDDLFAQLEPLLIVGLRPQGQVRVFNQN